MAVNWSCRRRCNSMKSCCLHAVNLGQKIAFDPPYSLIPWNCVNWQVSCCWIWARNNNNGPVFNITWYDHNGIEIVRCSKYILYGNWKIPCLSFLVSMTGSIWWQDVHIPEHLQVYSYFAIFRNITELAESKQSHGNSKTCRRGYTHWLFWERCKGIKFQISILKSNHLWFLTIWFGLVFGNHLLKTIPYSLHH